MFYVGPFTEEPSKIGRARNGLYFIYSWCHNCSSSYHTSSTTHDPTSYGHSILPISTLHVLNKETSDSFPIPCVRSIPTNNKEVCCNLQHPVNNLCPFESDMSPISLNNSVDHLWHTRLGHVPFGKMKGISTIPFSFTPRQPFTCTICPMARQARLPFPTKATP